MLHYVYSIFRQTHLLDIKGGDTCSVWRLHSCCHAHSHPGLVMGPRWDFMLRCYFRGREFSIRGADTYINIYIFKTAVAKEHVWRTQSNEATKLWVHWILWISSIHTLASLTPVAAQLKRQLTCYMINIDATKVGGPLTILRLLERPSEDDFCLISVENFHKNSRWKIKGKMHLHAFLHVLDLVAVAWIGF